MSEEDLERYESEIELGLVQEYRAVLPVFAYVIETERRFYLANEVAERAVGHDAGVHRARAARTRGCGTCTGPPASCRKYGSSPSTTSTSSGCPNRSSEGTTARPPTVLRRDQPQDDARAQGRGRGGGVVRRQRVPGGRPELALCCGGDRPALQQGGSPGCTTLVVCEVKARSSNSHGHPLEAVTPAKQRRLRRLATAYLNGQSRRYDHIRFDVAAATQHALHIVESAF